MTRANRSEFPGLAYVGNLLYETSYPDSEVDRVQGRTYVVELTDDVTRLPSFSIAVMTEAAAKEIEERSLRDEFVIEAPHAGDRVAGKSYRVRFRKQLVPDLSDRGTSGIFYADGQAGPIAIPYREIFAVFEVGHDECEVLEVAELAGPRELVLSAASA